MYLENTLNRGAGNNKSTKGKSSTCLEDLEEITVQLENQTHSGTQ